MTDALRGCSLQAVSSPGQSPNSGGVWARVVGGEFSGSGSLPDAAEGDARSTASPGGWKECHGDAPHRRDARASIQLAGAPKAGFGLADRGPAGLTPLPRTGPTAEGIGSFAGHADPRTTDLFNRTDKEAPTRMRPPQGQEKHRWELRSEPPAMPGRVARAGQRRLSPPALTTPHRPRTHRRGLLMRPQPPDSSRETQVNAAPVQKKNLKSTGRPPHAGCGRSHLSGPHAAAQPVNPRSGRGRPRPRSRAIRREAPRRPRAGRRR